MARVTTDERIPFRVKPMLATLAAEPFDRPGWVYEEKYDGYRLLAYKEGARVTLLSRNGLDKTAAFAPIAEAVRKLKARTLLLDGEAVAFDTAQVSRFQLLQRGAELSRYAVFDCIYVGGRDLRGETQAVRRAVLQEEIEGTERVFASASLAPNGLEAYRRAQHRGLEGVIAKDASSLYVEGRSRLWLKWKVHQEEEFAIAGFTAPAGERTQFGALLLGAYQGRELHYVGKVGTGFTQEALTSLAQAFKPLIRQHAPFVDPPREKNVTYLEPRLVAQISFQEWTADQKLRQPVFLGLRDDKKPRECVMPVKAGPR